jgi:hypothetical protein
MPSAFTVPLDVVLLAPSRLDRQPPRQCDAERHESGEQRKRQHRHPASDHCDRADEHDDER